MFLLFLVGEGRNLRKSQGIGRSWRGLGVITIRMSADTIRLWADRLMGAADTIRKMTKRWRGFLGKIVQEKRIYVKDCSFSGGFANFWASVDGEKVWIFRKKEEVLIFPDGNQQQDSVKFWEHLIKSGKKEKANEADLLKRLEEDKGTRKNTEEE